MKRAVVRSAMLVTLALALIAALGVSSAGAAVPPPAPGWSVMSVPAPAGSKNLSLEAVSCPSAKLCIAVGGSSLGTLAEEWNGASWSVQKTPSPSDTAWLTSLSCASATACLAVGISSSEYAPLAEYWNGKTWTVQPPPPGPDAIFGGVWCQAAKQCVVVGGDSRGALAEAWNGSSWTAQPGLSSVPAQLNSISCRSAQSCTAAGSHHSKRGKAQLATFTWNGTTWSPSQDKTLGLLRSVSCPGTLCVAVGENSTGQPIALNGLRQGAGRVTKPPLPAGAQMGFPNAVSCVSGVCEAVGGTDVGALFDRWTGTGWQLQSTGNTGELNGVACTSATACIAVGVAGDGSVSDPPLAMRYSG